MNQENINGMNCKFTERQVKLNNLMRLLWTEHVVWTRFFLISTAFELDDLDDVTNKLMENPTDFAYALSLFYCNQEAMRFEELLTEHIAIAGKLVNLLKRGDTKAADIQRERWYENADEIAVFLGEINPYWDSKAWQSMLYEHLELTEKEAVLILTGQYKEGIEQFDAVQDEALKMGDEMAYGIIKQFGV
ncbi:acetylglutamate kinase [Aminipila sp.]|jgi:hypothetical protein|uniref:acetylglutamate kinase n=1 Tax=Aminipila sp. TaxID=2060095 RepID=UPI00289EE651|nr:acetylglutamate kinase [Aminipila sp.]